MPPSHLWAGCRVIRTSPGKEDCFIIDHTGSRQRLGFLDDDIPWSLEGKDIREEKKKQQEERREPKEITCKSCGTVFRAARECPSCHATIIPMGKAIPTYQAELQEITKENKQQKLNRTTPAHIKAQVYGMLKFYAQGHGFKEGWAANKYRTMFGVWPNKHKHATPIPPSQRLNNWITSQNIRYAKRTNAWTK